VPIALEAGKALKDAKVSIAVRFKRLGESVFTTGDERIDNKLEIDIQPKEAVRLSLWFKAPGLSQDLVERTLSVGIEKDPLEVKLPDAYERVLFDAVAGDQTLFASTEEVLASWRYITPILSKWNALPLHIYEKGSAGPDVTELKKRYEKR
jgi:glucose-6-phosphate 1-dehydrogenase